MKIIKFRAWVPSIKKMMFSGIIDWWFQCCADNKVNPLRSQPGSIMLMFIGHDDKNGKEIYEGDIVKMVFPGSGTVIIGKVVFERAAFRITTDSIYFTDIVPEICEVLGNIYENPDLLK